MLVQLSLHPHWSGHRIYAVTFFKNGDILSNVIEKRIVRDEFNDAKEKELFEKIESHCAHQVAEFTKNVGPQPPLPRVNYTNEMNTDLPDNLLD